MANSPAEDQHTAHLHATQGLTPEGLEHGWSGDASSTDIRLAPGVYRFEGTASFSVELIQAVPIKTPGPVAFIGEALIVTEPVELRLYRGQGALNLFKT